MTPEFSRPVRIDTLGAGPRQVSIDADHAECAALAARFDLIAIARIEAALTLTRNGDEIRAEGTLSAAVTQGCVATGEPVAAAIDVPVVLLFRPEFASAPDEEVELGEDELDVIFYEGSSVDVGEGVAQTLLLALDPYPRAADADAVLAAKGVLTEEAAKAASSPFAVLKGRN